MCAMAAGVWLVGDRWLHDSATTGRLLEADSYELDSCDGSAAISDGECVCWHMSLCGCFDNMSGVRYGMHYSVVRLCLLVYA